MITTYTVMNLNFIENYNYPNFDGEDEVIFFAWSVYSNIQSL